MQSVETIKAKSQETYNSWITKIKEQPDEVKTWGVAAGSALAGALAVTALAKGVVSVAAAIASTPVALTVGAVGGGVLSWNYLQSRNIFGDASQAVESEEAVDPPHMEVPIATAAALNAGVVTVDEAVAYTVPAPTAVDTVEPVVALISTPATPVIDEAVVIDEPTMPEAAASEEAASDVTAPDVTLPDVSAANDFEEINGIGPVYARRLQNADIHTFAQLADLTPARVHEIVGSSGTSSGINAESWIAEARQLAEGSAT